MEKGYLKYRIDIFKNLGRAVAAIMIILGIIFFLFIVSALRHGYTWSEMDWNEKGYTTFGDLIASEGIGKEEFLVKEKVCYRYFTYKDGMPFKETCPVHKEQ